MASSELFCDPLWNTDCLPSTITSEGVVYPKSVSGSIDGIVCIYDNPYIQEDAMIQTINRVISENCYERAPRNGYDCRTMCLDSRYVIMGGAETQYAADLLYVSFTETTYTATYWKLTAEPTITEIIPGNQQLTVFFNPPIWNGASSITDYQYSTNNGSSYVSAGMVSPIIISNLTNGQSYSIRIRAITIVANVTYYGEPSTMVSGTPATAPDAPTNVVITAGNRQLAVTFSILFNGGSTILFYQYSKDGGAFETILRQDGQPNLQGSFMISDLTNGQSYSISVRASNTVANVVLYSAPSTPISGTPATAPDAPSITGITPGDRQLAVTCSIPYNGGSAITQYQYNLINPINPDEWTDAGDSPSFTILNLTNGQTYPVSVRASNIVANQNLYSAPSSPLSGTPATAPDAPSITGITPGDRQLEVTCSIPNNGGSAITQYQYNLTNPINPDEWTDAGDSPSFTILNLTNGQTYPVSVRASNIVANQNLYSAPSSPLSKTPATAPDAPSITGITPGDRQLKVTCSIPNNGGSAITQYQYNLTNPINPNEWTDAGNSSSFTILNLTNGQTYPVSVRASNIVANQNLYSAPSSPISKTPATAPDAPSITGITPGNRQLDVTCSIPNNGGSAITQYQYNLTNPINPNEWTDAGNSPSFTILNLTNGQTYPVSVRASNIVANQNLYSAPSSPISKTPATAPDAPSITGITPGDRQLAVTCSIPYNGGSAITQYQYNLTNPINPDEWTDAGAFPSFTISTLTNGQTYPVSVRASNIVANQNLYSAPSSPLSKTPTSVPDAPNIESIKLLGIAQLTIYFTQPVSYGSAAITKYQYSLDNGASFQDTPVQNPDRSFTIMNVVNGTYHVIIRAVNVINGVSRYGNNSNTSSTTLPEVPVINTFTINGTTYLQIFSGRTGEYPPTDNDGYVTIYFRLFTSFIPNIANTTMYVGSQNYNPRYIERSTDGGDVDYIIHFEPILYERFENSASIIFGEGSNRSSPAYFGFFLR